jgi:hypothetical protein
LLKKGVPLWIVLILCNWYSKLNVVVRWNNALSYSYNVRSGVRQGGSLSPALFNVFVDRCIHNVKVSGAGCIIDEKYLGIIMYADDILLLAPTIKGPQRQLDTCSNICSDQGLEFNTSKSVCMTFGPAHKYVLHGMLIQGIFYKLG